ncbi:MAG: haloacid dehalogenase-like hydrolase [Deltaproteobacteria bacterium]|nr:haloacid dehalogenase-like hydrolase [Deltaproteobacteria bacterium]
MHKSSVSLTLFLAATLGSSLGCGDDVTAQPSPDAPELPAPDAPVVDPCQPTTLRTDLAWHGTNRATLTTWLDSKGCKSPGYSAAAKPLALFDWDNTVVKNEVGDAITFYMIAQGKVRQPPNQDWKLTNKFMTNEGALALTAACGTTVPAGQPLPTNTTAGAACANEMLSMYIDNKTTTNLTAFTGHDYRRMEPTYAWTPQLMAGYSHAEVAQFAINATAPMFAAAEGTTQTIGTRPGLNGYLRIYDQIRDVITATQSRGYDVWVITASPQDLVGALAPMVGVPADHVIGIRSLVDGAGKLTYSFEGCGPVAPGQDMISYIEGKRCWINKVIFGDTSAAAIDRRAPADRARMVFAAGDSDTDIDFMRDSQYKLALNRAKTELMCFAYRNEGDTWRVNPMFIQPRAMRATPFPCSTTACKDASGAGVACRDDANVVIPDQADLVY